MLSDKNITRPKKPKITRRLLRKIHTMASKNKRQKINEHLKKNINIKEFSLITQNCIGGVLYNDLGMQFLSPTINLSFDGPDFIKFVQNLKYYISLELVEFSTNEVTYPVGHLDDIEIRFNHYTTFCEAKQKWDERKNRINYNKIYVIATDRDGMTNYNCMEQFDKLSYPKVMYTAKPYPQYSWTRWCKCFKDETVGIMTGIANLKGQRYYEKYFDIIRFLNKN